MRRYNNVVQSPTGQAIAGATVVVTVAASVPGTGPAATVYSDDGITVISNTVFTDNLGRFAFYVPSGKYDLAISGGTPLIGTPFVLANEEITDHLEFKPQDSIPLAGEVLNLTEVASGTTPSAGSINVYSKNVDNRLYYKDATGAEVGPLVGGSGVGSPAGLTGDIQKNSGLGTFAPSSLNDNGSRVLISNNTIFTGPNLGVDVTAFGARAVNLNTQVPTTASISAGSNVATVASAAGLQVGDGFSIAGADAVQSMPTPVAPTVVPSCNSALTGLGLTVPGGSGSTTYTYQIVLRDQKQGITAASAVATITTGAAQLGANSLPVTSVTAGNSNIFTVQVSSTANLAVGCVVVIRGTTADAEFGGVRVVASIVDATHFTFKSGIDASRGISVTSASGGTCYFWLCNHLTLPAPPAPGLQYLIYGRTPGSMQFIGESLIANLGYTDSSYNTWDDYGSPMMDNFQPHWWMPGTAPPSVAVNDTLTTTITNIAGNTLTLAATASTSVTNAPATFDNAPALTAALAAVNATGPQGGGTVKFPPIPQTIGGASMAYLIQTTVVFNTQAVIQDGILALGDTLKLSTCNWYGTDYSASQMVGPGTNSLRPHIQIFLFGANPGLWFNNAGGLNKVSIQCIRPSNGNVAIFNTGGNSSQIFEEMDISSGVTQDYMTVLFYDYHAQASGSFGMKVRNCSFATGPVQADGLTLTPAFISKYNTLMDFDYIAGNRRLGFAFIPFMSGFFHKIGTGADVQGNIVPMVTLINATPGNVGGGIQLENLVTDTSWYPLLVDLSQTASLSSTTSPNVVVVGGNMPSGAGYLSGQRVGGNVTFLGTGLSATPAPNFQLGQNQNINIVGSANQFNLSGFYTSQLTIGQTIFANLGSPANGTFVYCPDCTIANPCGGGGTGALAKRLNGLWVCN